MKKVLVTTAAVALFGGLLAAGTAQAEGCIYSQHADGMKKNTDLLALASVDATSESNLALWKLRGLDDAKRSRLLGQAPIKPIVPIHN